MNYTEQKLVAAVASEGLRPVLASLESGAPMSLLSLITSCWDADAKHRPPFTEIVAKLHSISEELKSVQEKRNIVVRTTAPQNSMEQSFNSQLYGESINWFSQGEQIPNKSLHAVDPGRTTSIDYPKDDSSYVPTLCWGSFATCGQREAMEDTHFTMPYFSDQKDIHFFGVFDGHRGAAAAEFSSRALPGLLQHMKSSVSPADYLVKAFVETDESFRSVLDEHRQSKGLIKKDWHPGCTAIVALLVKEKLFIANVGDCRAILCRYGNAIALSRDHVASCIEERDRIIKAGGVVKWQVDTWRVGSAALQVTRSIGDDDLKPFVSAEPEITETCLCQDDEYLVMASDGLWDVISNEEVVSIIKDTVKEPNMCSKRLATEAVQRGSKDNITVIVVFLRPVSTAERIY